MNGRAGADANSWQPDVLGEDFEALVLRVPAPAATGSSRATLVRYRPRGWEAAEEGTPRQAVLYLHGWSDYFFNTELADFWYRNRVDFYALDLHNHGRNIGTDSVGGFVADLDHYDPELAAALAEISPAGPGRRPVALMGHSTGGLVAALWASRHPEGVSHLVLNSPWLEMHSGPLLRYASNLVVAPVGRLWPERTMPLPARNFYWRSISAEADGEWTLERDFRPPLAFPIRFGWLRAILAGQAKVAKGLDLRIPVLVLMSSRSLNGPVWKDEMRTADAVLDVTSMAVRAVGLGSSVSVEKIDGALHDVLLSALPVRREAYARIQRWVDGFMAGRA